MKNVVSFTTGLKSYRSKTRITYVMFHNYAKVKVYSINSLPLEKELAFHNVIILIKLVFIKDRNNYCNNVFLEKRLNELPKNNDNK